MELIIKGKERNLIYNLENLKVQNRSKRDLKGMDELFPELKEDSNSCSDWSVSKLSTNDKLKYQKVKLVLIIKICRLFYKLKNRKRKIW